MKALGLIETIGMVTAIQAADICLKSSNVRLIGYEIIAGALVTIKIEGDVGAVKAAIDAAKISIGISNKLVSTLVIPRPSNGINLMIQTYPIIEKNVMTFNKKSNDFTAGNKKSELKQEELKLEIIESEVQFQYTDKDTEIPEKIIMEISEPINSIIDNETEKENVPILLKGDLKIDVCNLCHDILCTRKRGQHKSLCMHYKEKTQVTEGDVKYDIK